MRPPAAALSAIAAATARPTGPVRARCPRSFTWLFSTRTIGRRFLARGRMARLGAISRRSSGPASQPRQSQSTARPQPRSADRPSRNWRSTSRRMAGVCVQVTRRGGLVLAKQACPFRASVNLLRIVTSQTKPVARQQIRDGALQGRPHQLEMPGSIGSTATMSGLRALAGDSSSGNASTRRVRTPADRRAVAPARHAATWRGCCARGNTERATGARPTIRSPKRSPYSESARSRAPPDASSASAAR